MHFYQYLIVLQTFSIKKMRHWNVTVFKINFNNLQTEPSCVCIYPRRHHLECAFASLSAWQGHVLTENRMLCMVHAQGPSQQEMYMHIFENTVCILKSTFRLSSDRYSVNFPLKNFNANCILCLSFI